MYTLHPSLGLHHSHKDHERVKMQNAFIVPLSSKFHERYSHATTEQRLAPIIWIRVFSEIVLNLYFQQTQRDKC